MKLSAIPAIILLTFLAGCATLPERSTGRYLQGSVFEHLIVQWDVKNAAYCASELRAARQSNKNPNYILECTDNSRSEELLYSLHSTNKMIGIKTESRFRTMQFCTEFLNKLRSADQSSILALPESCTEITSNAPQSASSNPSAGSLERYLQISENGIPIIGIVLPNALACVKVRANRLTRLKEKEELSKCVAVPTIKVLPYKAKVRYHDDGSVAEYWFSKSTQCTSFLSSLYDEAGISTLLTATCS